MTESNRLYGEVIETEVLSPHMLRVVLGGPGLDAFEPIGDTDQYVNCFFLPEGAPYEVPFTDDAIRDLPRDQRPFARRITVRAWDPQTRQLALDFVAHGEIGYAGRWALHARPGDRLQLRGPAGGYRPEADADSYLLVGDASALPAIAASAEAVPEGRPVVIVAEVPSAEDEIPLESPGELTVRWVHTVDGGDAVRLLADAVAALPRPEGVVSAFVHGEAESVRAVRRVLLSERIVAEDRLSCSPYWRLGHDDEAWRSVKAAWVREVAAETLPSPVRTERASA
ncbi:siderophore-interacting protein [Microbacterium aurantiacum]|uniref:siderophore-interacting protein n=1 Tax=Microbacterium aurantiacum TaxID=162393 RepID=UPI001FEB0BED|nr:siderophore-interacting protein [Microbacterium aurantiacum]